jgi:hypothetical protein
MIETKNIQAKQADHSDHCGEQKIQALMTKQFI